ncbi:MAG: Hsp70 family protein [Clostridia bacterium]|nr:Hsp70 family protein [Clostridia bacterium]
MYLGIDFGTCFSSIAGIGGDSKTLPITHIFEKHVKGIPSLFMYSKEKDKNLFGDDCLKGEAKLHSADVVRYMKKRIRQNPNHLNQKVTSGGKTFDISDIVESYLRYLITTAQQKAVDSHEFRKSAIEGITVTTPNGIAGGYTAATDYNAWLKKTLMKITGLPETKVHTLHEPFAAAICYLYGNNVNTRYTNTQTVLVFDLGGGTLDVTIVEHDPSGHTSYKVKAEEGDLTLGGNDWDAALAKYILSQKGLREEDFSAEEKARFYEDVTRLKEELSETNSFEIPLRCGGKYDLMTCSRTEFERATVGLLNRAVNLTQKAIQSYQESVGAKKLDKIILVGGASNMPQIKERMIAEFGSTVGINNIISHEPSKAIAKGAAIYTKHFAGHTSIPLARTKLEFAEIATMTYGFKSTRREDGREMIYNILYKGTPFGKKKRIRKKAETSFVALNPNQKEISFVVYESEARQGKGEYANWMDLGSDEAKNGLAVSVPVPRRYRGKANTYHCFPSFSLDKDGILKITVYSKYGRKLASERKKL